VIRAPLTRTSPGSVNAEGAVGSRAPCSAPHDDTNASFRMKSQSLLRRKRLKLKRVGPPSKSGSPGANVDRAFTRSVGPCAQWDYRRRRPPVFGRNAQIAVVRGQSTIDASWHIQEIGIAEALTLSCS
jgi:hypothetical protein